MGVSTLKLYTIQTCEAVLELISKGRYICKEEKSKILRDYGPDFRKAYYWLVERMKEKIGPAPDKDIKFPVWAWGDIDSKNWKDGAGEIGTTMYRIDFEIEDSKVVTSDFVNWHLVIYDEPFIETEEEYSYYVSLPKEQQEFYKLNSWKKIFVSSDADAAQYTFWELRLEDVTNIIPFVVPENNLD